jgi:RNA polymerase sigma-70 factor (ECF subfamily)
MTRAGADADDLLQATCLRALERGPALRNHANVWSWLVRVMRNLHLDKIRGPAQRSTALPADDELAEPPSEPIALWRQLADEDLERVVPRLSPQLRVVWQLHHQHGLDQRQIAARLLIPRATVATRVFRARAALRQQLLALHQNNARDFHDRRSLPANPGAALLGASPPSRPWAHASRPYHPGFRGSPPPSPAVRSP